jgi:hypothetical protein
VNFDLWSKACIGVGIAPSEFEYRRVRRSWSGSTTSSSKYERQARSNIAATLEGRGVMF